jgi:diaminohydroxyphosphoribosylaminopyrimidine deaminase/5-amino-6-(5-phosphoribosylamino)uracil reductase
MPEQPRAIVDPPASDRWGEDDAWRLARAAAAHAASAEARADDPPSDLALDGTLRARCADCDDVALTWQAGTGWLLALDAGDPRAALLDLYLPVCSATPTHPVTVGHLGQSLDGFIATQSGDSRFVTGEQNIRHLHRMRALCDAIVVGAGTVVADDPQLTTRHVPGTSPLRVVLDPTRRLSSDYHVFRDGAAPTWYVCERTRVDEGETTFGDASIVGLESGNAGVDLAALLRRLPGRGCARVFIEGGGVTVSAFLEAGLLDRLQMAIAPFLIGDGRPAIRLPGPAVLSDCARPRYRVFRMGSDVLFDIDFSSQSADMPLAGDLADVLDAPPVTRVL